MKCIHCSHNADYKKRQANRGRCFKCGRDYAFEPKTDKPKISDPFFQNAIQKISDEGQLFFTERQLWHELNRRLLRKQGNGIGCLVIFVGFGLFWLTSDFFLSLLIAGVVGVVGFGLSWLFKTEPTSPLSFSRFREEYLPRWIKVHGKPNMLWEPLNNREVRLEKDPASSDLQTYSFDQAIVTETSEMAQLLVANNFHFDNKCAVLSLDGYPLGMADTILQMLRRNPQLIVFALHDASIEGCRSPFILRQAKWFPDQSIKIVDLGMFPRHAQAMKLIFPKSAAKAVPTEIQSLLKPKEVTWLEEGREGELEALSSNRLMRTISRGMALTKKRLEEHATSGLPLPIIAGVAGGLIIFDEDLFGEKQKKDNNWNDHWG